MRAWLFGALLCLTASVGLAAWWSLDGQDARPTQALAPARAPASTAHLAPAPPTAAAVLPAAALAQPAPREPVADAEQAPSLSVPEAQMLMQLMAEQGDPRSPALGQRQPRQAASAAQLADPAQYRDFEEQHSRALIKAYTGGIEQIPAIRQRIEEEAQAGRRSAEEIDEARAALQQLEMLQSKLQREAPELLP